MGERFQTISDLLEEGCDSPDLHRVSSHLGAESIVGTQIGVAGAGDQDGMLGGEPEDTDLRD